MPRPRKKMTKPCWLLVNETQHAPLMNDLMSIVYEYLGHGVNSYLKWVQKQGVWKLTCFGCGTVLRSHSDAWMWGYASVLPLHQGAMIRENLRNRAFLGAWFIPEE